METIGCARIPAHSLASLASLRTVEGVLVLLEGDRAWVFWENGDNRVLRVLLPVEAVELFERRGDSWYRWGRRLPSFEVPDHQQAIPIERAIFPAPFQTLNPSDASPRPSTLRLVRDGRQRPSTAALCPLVELGRWAELAPSHAIESIRGAIQGDQAFLLGRGLPPWPGSTRYWGERILVPIGFQVRPSLPEKAILDALGSSGLEVFCFFADENQAAAAIIEAIPFDVFRPLSRAGVRLALRASSQ